MSEIKWIKITTSIFDDEAIKIIEQMPEGDALLVIWLKLLIQAGIINDSGLVYFKKNIPYTEEMLAIVFHKPIPVIKLALTTFEKFGMVEIADNKTILIRNWEKHQNIAGMEQVREYHRIAKQKQRKKAKELKLLTSQGQCQGHVLDSHETDIDKDIDIEYKEIDKSISLYDEKKKKNSKKTDPYVNQINQIFSKEYEKVFNAKPYLMANQRNKLAELTAEIENFKETIPVVLDKLKNVEFSLPNFTANYIWLLTDDNYIKVLSGTYDKKPDPWDEFVSRGGDEFGN